MVKLVGSSPYLGKDQRKADRANKFIGRGSARSSTNSYRQCFGALANCGVYTSSDKVFVSAEGMRSNRLNLDYDELQRAVNARATFITDGPIDRARSYNIGERDVASFLKLNKYAEITPGLWQPA